VIVGGKWWRDPLTGKPGASIFGLYVVFLHTVLHVLLLASAGVWLGLRKFFPTHPASRVGFVFQPALTG
jgi:hypothetical protein